MLSKNPTCSSCADGEIKVVIEVGPIRQYQFKLSGPGIINPQWVFADSIPHGKTKTFTGLKVGKYLVSVATDPDPNTQKCVTTYDVELFDPCPHDALDNCILCQNALDFTPVFTSNGTLVKTVGHEAVRFLNKDLLSPADPFPAYSWGERTFTVEAWVRVKDSPYGGTIFMRTNHPGTGGHWTQVNSTNPGVKGFAGLYWSVNWFGGTPRMHLAVFDEKTPLHTTATAYVGNVDFLRVITLESLNSNDINHVVLVFKDARIGAGVSAAAAQTDYDTQVTSKSGGAVHAFIKYGFTMYINGVECSFDTTSNTYDINHTYSDLSNAQCDYLSDVNNFTGPIWIGQEYKNSNTLANPEYASSSLVVTNFRIYTRELTRTEIQRNTLLGCKEPPTNCKSLILYAPLNQRSGQIASELVFNNMGELINYTGQRLIIGGGAWVSECCGPTGPVGQYVCEQPDCEDDFTLMKVKFKPDPVITFSDPQTYLVVITNNKSCIELGNALVVGTNCYAYANVSIVTPTSLNDVIDGIKTGLTTAITTATNSVLPTTTTIEKNSNELIFRIPHIDGGLDYCGLPYSICLYRINTEANLVAQDGSLLVTHHAGRFAVCCIPGSCDVDENIVIKV